MEHKNIWAPWRSVYLEDLEKKETKSESSPCFLCQYSSQPERDKENLVLWRTEKIMVLMNRYPYTGGHMLIAPRAHIPNLNSLDDATLLEMMHHTRDVQNVLTEIIKPHGFNIGINLGRCAGAGLPDHMHLHVVPRWNGDTNFMSVTGDVRVVSVSLEDLYQKMIAAAEHLNLPKK